MPSTSRVPVTSGSRPAHRRSGSPSRGDGCGHAARSPPAGHRPSPRSRSRPGHSCRRPARCLLAGCARSPRAWCARAARRWPGSRRRRAPTPSLAAPRRPPVSPRLEADRAGVDEALYPTRDGGLAEATSANLFAITADRLVTPPAEAGILIGTTLGWLLDATAAAALGLTPQERPLTAADLLSADEAFVCSSVAGIVPLVALDGRPIGSGHPG